MPNHIYHNLFNKKGRYPASSVKDAEWIAALLRHGLLKDSYTHSRNRFPPDAHLSSKAGMLQGTTKVLVNTNQKKNIKGNKVKTLLPFKIYKLREDPYSALLQANLELQGSLLYRLLQFCPMVAACFASISKRILKHPFQKVFLPKFV